MRFSFLFASSSSDDSGPPGDSQGEVRATPGRTRTAQSAEDASLIGRIKSGDKDAFESLYRRYYVPMVAFTAPYVRDTEAARDLVSDLFLKLWQKRNEWKVQTSIATYLYQSLRHRASNVQRDAGVDARNISLAAAAGVAIGAGSPSTPADEEMLRQERVEILWRAVNTLSEPRRTIVVLRWREQMSFDEIASVVGTSPAAVQMQLSRALKTLRETLTGLK